MKRKTKYSFLLSLIAFLGICFTILKPTFYTSNPQPTSGTFVKTDMEEGELKSLKQKWMQLIHNASPDINWQEVERKNSLDKFNIKLEEIRNGDFANKDGQVNIANGSVIGYWSEKGSNNQAGSIINNLYNPIDNNIYLISAGGSFWKGDINGLNWEVVNQDLRFDGRFLIRADLPDGNSRFISSINGHPYYSTGGLEWSSSNTFPDNTSPKNKNALSIESGKDIFFLSKLRSGENVKLYHSDDYGKSFHAIKTFLTSDLDNMSVTQLNDIIYVIEQKSISTSRIYNWDSENDVLAVITENSNFSFGESGKANLKAVDIEGTTILYAYNGNNELKKTINFGQTWDLVSVLPKKPWEGGFFISSLYPNIMIIGEIEAYRSVDAGRTWNKINAWYEYYDNKTVNLHADIMSISEYETPQGNVFSISNHGGLSTSFNNGSSFGNIGLTGLNVSQYYDVETYPLDHTIIFCGSQDQGIQRTLDLNEGPAYFEQIISGDYGHLTFTNNDQSLWAVFPGGWVSYYDKPLMSHDHAYSAYYDLEYGQESVWIPPIKESPYHHNAVLLAGGNLQGTQSSHLIELKIDDLGDIKASQLPFNFKQSGGEISAMGYNNFNSREFYVMTSNGKFYKSIDSAQNFSEKNNGLSEAHYLYGSSILCSKINQNIIYVTGSGYSNAAVFKSEDRGESFVSMNEGLPPTTVFKLVPSQNERFIFAATEAGPYVFIKKYNRWYDLAQGIAPNQAFWDVEYLKDENKVRFASYGRGIWDFDITQLTATNQLEVTNEFKLSPNPGTDFINLELGTFKGSINIMSCSGHIIKTISHQYSSVLKIDISHFNNGLYYVIFDDGSKLSSKTFIKI